MEDIDKTILLIQCPKCLKRLKRKQEGWSSYVYCFNCETRYDVLAKPDEMVIEIIEVSK